jgi:glycosyltransferase involved in cell wall biosynthesis/CBS domain-containing protein
VTNSDVYFRILLELPVISGTNLDTPTIDPNDSVVKIIDQFIDYDIGAVVAVQNNKPVGIVTEKDVLEKVLNEERDPAVTIVKNIMSIPVITIESTDSVKNAIELMRKNNIRRLAVTQDGILVGITTERRLLSIAHRIYVENTRLMPESINVLPDKPIISYLSSYPPRECGIATFTKDLVDSIDRLNVLSPPIISAINDQGGYYRYPPQVKIQIDRDDPDTYIKAAKIINDSSIQALNLQHEYGLFGGTWGDYLIDFLEELDKPVITTLHTILKTPNRDAERVMKEVLRLSHRIVVIARIGSRILEQIYDTLPDKVRHIPHGCPNVPFVSSKTVKNILGYNNRIILSTFGLLSRGKGIEYAIKALPDIVEKEPSVLYLIIGQTHPEVRKHEGESYRQSLIDLVKSLGVENNVRFINRFLSKNELIRFLQATDIYILPYPNPEQISSGTMLYALCTGKAIVTTPFLHAQEVIAQGAAFDCQFKDPESITWSVNALLTSRQLHDNFQRRAYAYTRDMIWPNVAMKYVNLFYESIGI